MICVDMLRPSSHELQLIFREKEADSKMLFVKASLYICSWRNYLKKSSNVTILYKAHGRNLTQT